MPMNIFNTFDDPLAFTGTTVAFGVNDKDQIRPGLEKKRFTRVVASGTNQRIGFYHALNPDCSASGNVSIRVTKQPEHGSAETIAAMDFPNYPKQNIRSKCNDHKVRGVQVNYKSRRRNTSVAMK
jgi:hypothetical protein